MMEINHYKVGRKRFSERDERANRIRSHSNAKPTSVGLGLGVPTAIGGKTMPSKRLVDGEKSYEGVIVIARSDLGDEAIRIAERRRLLRKHGSQ
jgi:hypothetical protein